MRKKVAYIQCLFLFRIKMSTTLSLLLRSDKRIGDEVDAFEL